MKSDLEKAIEKRIMKDITDSWFPDSDFWKVTTPAASTVNNNDAFTLEQLNNLVEKLDLNLTPKERTLKATDGKYDTVGVKNMETLVKLREKFGNLNYELNKIFGDSVVLYNSYGK